MTGFSSRRVELTGVFHYHQRAGVHPSGRTIQRGMRCIELVTGGRGEVEVAGEWLPVSVGTLLWHYPGDGTIGRSVFDDPYRCLSVSFKTADRSPREVPRLSYWRDMDEVLRLTREVVGLFADERFDREVLADYLIGRLYFQARLDHWRRRDRMLPAPLGRVLAMIDDHYGEDLPVERLAQAAGWSVPHLHEVFREHMDQTPHQYLIERRLRAARERLMATAQPVKSIAVDCGFSSAAAFCTVFRRMTGQSPAAFRKEQELV